MCRLVFLFVLLAFQGTTVAERETFCRDETGIVDWWILYKEAGDTRYVYLSSAGVKKNPNKTFTEPLRNDRRIDDPKTSPFLLTVYGSNPYTDEELDKSKKNKMDNHMILAWNDQQPKGPMNDRARAAKMKKDAQKTKRQKEMDKLDSEVEEDKYGRNMYGKGDTELFAHSKGILGLSVDSVSKTKDKATAKFYLINHSFPKTPEGLWEKTKYPIKRRFVKDPTKFFGANITAANSKAQHAMCISMKQEVKLKNGQIVFNREQLIPDEMNLFSILNGLDTIGPSLTLTNYVPHLKRFKIYHQLFNVTDHWSKDDPTSRTDIVNSNVTRVITKEKLGDAAKNYSKHAYPLWPTRSKVDFSKDMAKKSGGTKQHTSLRDPNQIYATRCQVWNAEGPRKDRGCHFVAQLRSTDSQSQIVFDVDFKNGLMKVDTDDFIASRLVPTKDAILANSGPASSSVKKAHVALSVVTQSWFDHATFGSHPRNIIDTDKIRIKAWFHNNLAVFLPQKDGDAVIQKSNGLDHSKWFVSYLYEQTGRYIPLAGVMDLNRNAKATCLTNKEVGRGGMILSSTNSAFVRFFMSLSPIIENNSNFTNFSIEELTANHIKTTNGVKATSATFKSFAGKGASVKIVFDGCRVESTFALPYCVAPARAALLNSVKPSDDKTSSTPFDLGSEGIETTPYKTPRRMEQEPGSPERTILSSHPNARRKLTFSNSKSHGHSKSSTAPATKKPPKQSTDSDSDSSSGSDSSSVSGSGSSSVSSSDSSSVSGSGSDSTSLDSSETLESDSSSFSSGSKKGTKVSKTSKTLFKPSSKPLKPPKTPLKSPKTPMTLFKPSSKPLKTLPKTPSKNPKHKA